MSEFLILGKTLQKIHPIEGGPLPTVPRETLRSMTMCGVNPTGDEEQDGIWANLDDDHARCLSIIHVFIYILIYSFIAYLCKIW